MPVLVVRKTGRRGRGTRRREGWIERGSRRKERNEREKDTGGQRKIEMEGDLVFSHSLFLFSRPMSRRRFGGPTLGATWLPSVKGSLSKG